MKIGRAQIGEIEENHLVGAEAIDVIARGGAHHADAGGNGVLVARAALKL